MNILYIVHDNKKGGAAISFIEMISRIRREHNVYVLTPHKRGFLPHKLDEMKIPHYNAHFFWWEIAVPDNKMAAYFRLFVYRVLNVYNYIEAYRLKRMILQKDIDIIHSNSSVINFGALLSKRTGIPHIWHLREFGEDFGFKKVVSQKRYQRELNEYADCFIAISKSLKNKFSNVIEENRIIQIYNGVDETKSYEKDICPKRSEVVKFLISGNYCKEKGQADVVKAAMELYEQGLKGFRVYLAGGGDFEEPRRLVVENGLQNVVEFCGFIDDMQQLRKDVDVEIVACKYEAFGRVTIEAMRMSNPVIGTNTGGTPELITDGVNGFLFEYGNYIQLAECMKKYILDHTLAAKMGAKAYQTMKGKFTPDENAKRILEVYTNIRR